MSRYSILVVIFAVSTFTSVSFAESNSFQPSKMEQAVLNVGSNCQGIVVDQQKYDYSIASGASPEQSKRYAAVQKKFNRVVYDGAVAAGANSDDAAELATSYKYSDNSEFCVKFRSLVRSELEKNIAQ